MRGLPGAIFLLLLAGGAIAYLALEKFAPRVTCECDEECQGVVSAPTPIPEVDDPTLPSDRSEQENITLKDEWERIEQEKTWLETWEKELEEEAQRLWEWEQYLNQRDNELGIAEHDLIFDQEKIENNKAEIDARLHGIALQTKSLEEQLEQVQQAKTQLERLQIGTLILVDVILIGALLVFGLPSIRSIRPQRPHPDSS